MAVWLARQVSRAGSNEAAGCRGACPGPPAPRQRTVPGAAVREGGGVGIDVVPEAVARHSGVCHKARAVHRWAAGTGLLAAAILLPGVLAVFTSPAALGGRRVFAVLLPLPLLLLLLLLPLPLLLPLLQLDGIRRQVGHLALWIELGQAGAHLPQRRQLPRRQLSKHVRAHTPGGGPARHVGCAPLPARRRQLRRRRRIAVCVRPVPLLLVGLLPLLGWLLVPTLLPLLLLLVAVLPLSGGCSRQRRPVLAPQQEVEQLLAGGLINEVVDHNCRAGQGRQSLEPATLWPADAWQPTQRLHSLGTGRTNDTTRRRRRRSRRTRGRAPACEYAMRAPSAEASLGTMQPSRRTLSATEASDGSHSVSPAGSRRKGSGCVATAGGGGGAVAGAPPAAWAASAAMPRKLVIDGPLHDASGSRGSSGCPERRVELRAGNRPALQRHGSDACKT